MYSAKIEKIYDECRQDFWDKHLFPLLKNNKLIPIGEVHGDLAVVTNDNLVARLFIDPNHIYDEESKKYEYEIMDTKNTTFKKGTELEGCYLFYIRICNHSEFHNFWINKGLSLEKFKQWSEVYDDLKEYLVPDLELKKLGESKVDAIFK